MLRRRSGSRGPGLARTVARTAVIAGTATATSNAVHARQQQRHQAASAPAEEPAGTAQLQEQVSALQAEQLASDMQHAPNTRQDFVSQLQQLGELRTQGILSEEEFSKAKAMLLEM